MTICTL